ncbi:MAG: hypothetical protein J0M01_16905 [Dechloromonas sp.]|nr:hypothetical protein [Dechloromonas sp.]
MQDRNGVTCLIYVSSNSKPNLMSLLPEKAANDGLKDFDEFWALDLPASIDCPRLLRKAA